MQEGSLEHSDIVSVMHTRHQLLAIPDRVVMKAIDTSWQVIDQLFPPEIQGQYIMHIKLNAKKQWFWSHNLV